VKIYHLAIPKTATESIQKSMIDAGLDVYITMKYEPYINYVEAISHNIISGHFHYGIHALISPRKNYKYITTLREPLERAISNYYDYQKSNHNVKDLTLEEYLLQIPKNIITIQMCGFGIESKKEAIEIIKKDYLLAKPIQRIASFYNYLSVLLEKPIVISKENINVNKKEIYISEDFKREFELKHDLDYEIYNRALDNKLC
jgi:hypothetical protein